MIAQQMTKLATLPVSSKVIGKNKRLIQILIVFLLLIMAILAVYSQSLQFDFINYDDQEYVSKNFRIQNGFTLSNILWALTTTHFANWHPLTWMSYMLDYELYGLWAGGYHLTNVIFHALNALLLFLLLRRMTESTKKSFFVAALFALHPLHVESVAWISERKDVLSTFFWLLTVWAYAIYVQAPGVRKYLVVVVFFIFGIMSKPMVVTLPFVLILLDYWPLNRLGGADNQNDATIGRAVAGRKRAAFLIAEKMPLLAIAVFSGIVTYVAQKQAGAMGAADFFPWDVRIVNAVVSYASYIVKMIWPDNLSVFYPHPVFWPMSKVVLSGILLLACSLLAYMCRRRYPYFAVGWLFYIGTLVPVIGLVQVGTQAMADRYTYIPLIGLFIAIVWGVSDIFRSLPYRRVVFSIVSVLILGVFTFLSWQRCLLWGNNLTLWNDVLKNHQVAFAYMVRGIGYAEKGQYELAVKDYNAALNMDGNFAAALSDRAIAYGNLGQYQKAFADFDRALRIAPNLSHTYYALGMFHKFNGRNDLAIYDLTQAIKINPDMAVGAYNDRGSIYAALAQYDRALSDFNEALRINRNFAEAYYNRGTLYNIQKKYDLALADFGKALEIKPGYADAYNNRGFSLEGQGRLKEALEQYLTALRVEPRHARAHNNAGNILLKAGKYGEAVIYFQRALQIRPDYEDAQKNLRKALEKTS